MNIRMMAATASKSVGIVYGAGPDDFLSAVTKARKPKINEYITVLFDDVTIH